jgi:DNA-binding NtrC family response regulator/pSer/pThr/pTyr-binding forkhead associated (FHA) protein
MSDAPWGKETQDFETAPRGAEWERLQLVVVQEASSQVVPLRSGPFTIGRAPEADLVIDDPSISRLHTRLLVTDGSVVLSDLGSRNGTLLNGAAVGEPRAVAPGDVITLGKVTLVVQGQRARGEDPLLPLPQLRERLAEELARSTHYERPLAVIALSLPTVTFAAAHLVKVKALLRAHDRAALDSPSLLLLFLPELDEHEARELADQALATLSEPSAGAGISLFPEDGTEGEALLSAAREAASAPGVQFARERVARVALGDQVLIVADPAMRGLHRLLQRLAPSDLPVLISGETGTGKELVALALHASSRQQGPFVVVNCAALPETLAESELFGHQRGAFSGATADKAGYFEAANRGTLFLDEVGELPLPVQAKLLRSVETRQIVRLGDTRPLSVDVRVVAATHRDLAADVKAGRFREDLYFRLAAAQVALPPLRSRPREIPLLARTFLEQACKQLGREVPGLDAAALAQLSAYAWPGNVRELRNVMAAVAALHEGPRIDEVPLGRALPPAPPLAPLEPRRVFPRLAEELRSLERARMVEALEACGGVQKRAAQLIGMPLRTFVLKAKQYGLQARR